MKLKRDKARADKIIAFIQQLKITIGPDVGKPFTLAPFQIKFIRDIYEPYDPKKPKKRFVTRGVFSIGRKNGKSELAAALVLAHLIGPESELNGSIISAATSRRQAKMVFEAVCRFMNMSPELHQYLRVVESTSTIYVRPGMSKRAAGSRYQAIAAQAGGAHGLNPSVVIFDELAQATSRKFFDALITAQGARSEPFFMVISTQNEDPTHIMSILIDDGLRTNEDGSPINPRTVVHLYAAEEGCDIMDEKAWYAANPGLGKWIDLDRFRADAQEAQRNPSEEAQFRLFRLNQRVSVNTPVVSRHDWLACMMPPSTPKAGRKQADFQFEKGEKLYGGLDMSARTDLTALVMCSEERALTKSWFWKCEVDLQRHFDRDGFDYPTMVKLGWMESSPGRTIDPALVVRKIAALHADYKIQGIAYDRDPKHMDEFMRIADQEGLRAQVGVASGGISMIPWGQGFISMQLGVMAIEEAVLNGKMQHDGNPLLTWNLANSTLDTDAKGNRKLIKLNPRFRIDGSVCLAMALGLRSNTRPTKKKGWAWDDEDFDMNPVEQAA